MDKGGSQAVARAALYEVQEFKYKSAFPGPRECLCVKGFH